MSRSVKKFSPQPGKSYQVDAYLSDLRHHFQRCPGMTLEDKIFLIRLTSDAVGSLIDRKRNLIANDYEKLEAAVRKEYTYNSQEAGIQLALSVKQGRTEDPQVFYQCLFNAYFGTECKDGMEEEKGFKALFLENLHAQYSPYMGTVDPKTTPMDEHRRMASCAFTRFGKTSKSLSSPSVLAVEEKTSLRLEGAAYGTHKNKNQRAGPKSQVQKPDNNPKQKGFPNNRPQNPNRPRTPPPAPGGDPKTPRRGCDKHRVSFREKGVLPGSYRRESPCPSEGHTPLGQKSPCNPHKDYNPAPRPRADSGSRSPDKNRALGEIRIDLLNDSKVRESVLCITAVEPPQPACRSTVEAGPAKATPATTVHSSTPEVTVRPAVVASIDACTLVPTEPETRPSKLSSSIKLPQRVLCSINQRGSTNKPHIPVTLEGVLDCEALMDMGSDYNIMSSSLWEQVRMAAAAQGRIIGLTTCVRQIQLFSAD
uniref:Uncharacterized protein n=1 Tax=Nothobranchius furzeri TaxID=105023 RepID=A0A8C6LF49_NOTFU